MGDTWVDPHQYVRGYNAQEGTLMDLGGQLLHRGAGEAVWSGSSLGNWQSTGSNSGRSSAAAEEIAVRRDFETGSFFGGGGGGGGAPVLTYPRPFQVGGSPNSYAAIPNVECAQSRAMVSEVLDSCVSSRDPSYCVDYSLNDAAEVRYQLGTELDIHRREAERRRAWRNNFEAITQVRRSTDPNSVVSTEHSPIDEYVTRGMSTALDCSLASHHKSGIDYTSSIPATGAGNSGQPLAGMLHGSRTAELNSPSIYSSRGAVVGLNSSISAQQNSDSGMAYSERILETSPFDYSTPVLEERVATNDSSGEPIDCLIGDFQTVGIPDAMSPAVAPVFKRSSWEIVNDGFDLLSHGSCSKTSNSFPWRSEVLVSDICHNGHNSSSSFMLPDTSKHYPAVELSSSCVLDEKTIEELSLVPSVLPVQSNLPLNTPESPEFQPERGPGDKNSSRREGSGSEMIFTQQEVESGEPISTDGTKYSTARNEAVKEVAEGRHLKEESADERTTVCDGTKYSTARNQAVKEVTKRRQLKEESADGRPTVCDGTKYSVARNQELKEVAKGRQLKEESANEPTTVCEEGDKETGDKTDRTMRMMTTVMRFAETVDRKDGKALDSAREVVQEFCSVSGDYTQRVAHYFFEALSARLATESCKDTATEEEPYQLPHELLEDCKFMEACPYTKFAHLTANQAFLEAAEGADSVHIIDIGLMQGVQWSALLQALVSSAGPKAAVPPKKIRITGVASPKLGSNASDSLQRTGRRLTEFAEMLGLQIEFQSIYEEVQNLDAKSFHIREGEMVAVNFMLQLHQYKCEEDGERVTKILKVVYSLKPKVVVLVEYEAAVNIEASDGQIRLLDALKHYCAIFQSLEVLPRDSRERTTTERDILGREIRKMFSTTIDKGAMMHASFAQWKELFTGLGFQAVKPSHYSFSQARLLLRMYEGPYRILNNSESLSLSWHDRVVMTVSAWHCT